MFEVDLTGLPTMMLYELADRCKELSLACEEPRLLVRAKALEIAAGQRRLDEAMLEVAA